jgi:uncharacterized protein (DUF2336 family)
MAALLDQARATTNHCHESLIAEIEAALQGGSPNRRADTLRNITDLFLDSARRLSSDQVSLFDDVIGHLIDQIEIKALVELGERLAPVPNAPEEVIRRLAHHDDVAVAGPVLVHSLRLSEGDLLEIAQTKGQAHLLAMASRKQVDPMLTDVLVRRGNNAVLQKVAGNSGARFSHDGFGVLVDRARNDGALAEQIIGRRDVPPHFVQALVVRATEVVHRHLLAVAPPEIKLDIERVLAKVSAEMTVELAAGREGSAVDTVRSMYDAGQLTERDLESFARAGRFDEAVAALALISAMPVEIVDGVMRDDRVDPIVIIAKSAGLQWNTLYALVTIGRGGRGVSALDLQTVRHDFDRLTQSTAQRVVRFWRVRQTNKTNPGRSQEAVTDGAML